MKKLMLVLVAGLMAMALASTASAATTVGGSMEIRYDLWHNLRMIDDAAAPVHTQTFFADRILLNVDAKITDGLEAYVELETGNGDVDATSERIWGGNKTNDDGEHLSDVNFQGERLNVRQAWINFMIPGIPVGVKIGHQPLALGHGIFLNTQRNGTDAILVYSKPIDTLLIAGVFAKVFENSNSTPGDLSSYEHYDRDYLAALANFTFMPNNTVGVHYSYIHVPGLGAGNRTVQRTHNVGLTADGAIAMINYKAEADYMDVNQTNGAVDKGLVNAWAFMLGASAKVAMINAGLEVAYGTGTSPSKTSGSRTYDATGLTSYNYAFLYNDKIGQGPGGSGGGSGFGDGTGGFGLANTGYVKLSLGVNPMDKLNAGVDVLYLNASQASFQGQRRDLGWEVDAHADYKIYDNLNLNLTGGVFIPGDWYTDANAHDQDAKPVTAYGLETKLTVNF